jgi:hypothetical protein
MPSKPISKWPRCTEQQSEPEQKTPAQRPVFFVLIAKVALPISKTGCFRQPEALSSPASTVLKADPFVRAPSKSAWLQRELEVDRQVTTTQLELRCVCISTFMYTHHI